MKNSGLYVCCRLSHCEHMCRVWYYGWTPFISLFFHDISWIIFHTVNWVLMLLVLMYEEIMQVNDGVTLHVGFFWIRKCLHVSDCLLLLTTVMFGCSFIPTVNSVSPDANGPIADRILTVMWHRITGGRGRQILWCVAGLREIHRIRAVYRQTISMCVWADVGRQSIHAGTTRTLQGCALMHSSLCHRVWPFQLKH